MSKCSQCRKYPVQDSLWDKFRLSLFHVFHNDIIDLSQDKFTQGFSDGYVMGRKHQKETDQVTIDLLSQPVEKKQLFPIFDPEKVLTSNKNGIMYLNGVVIDKKKLDQLRSEAIMLRRSLLWEIVVNSLNQQAQEVGWTKSKELQDLMNGKMISYTLDIQEKIIQKIERAK